MPLPVRAHPRQCWPKPLPPSLPGALLTGQSDLGISSEGSPNVLGSPESGSGVLAASPKPLGAWDLGEPEAGRLSSHLAHG